MGISEIFIKRPVLATLFMATILLFGIFGYRLLPVSVLPDIDFPTVQVSVSLPGADPTTMASSVALPLEKQFSTISNIDSMSSVNSAGSTQITLQFDLSRDMEPQHRTYKLLYHLLLNSYRMTYQLPHHIAK